MPVRAWTCAAALTGLIAACRPPGPDRPHVTLGPDLAALRADFNADTGRTRIVMLVSPT